jgi:hypothetical protein
MFNSSAALGEPEVVARVAHVKATPDCDHLVGLSFESPQDHRAGLAQPERRIHRRASLALPLRARRADIRWPEETMTADVSEQGIRFPSARFYAVGDPVRVALIYQYDSWELADERAGHVVRVEPAPDSVLDSVVVSLGPRDESQNSA